MNYVSLFQTTETHVWHLKKSKEGKDDLFFSEFQRFLSIVAGTAWHDKQKSTEKGKKSLN